MTSLNKPLTSKGQYSHCGSCQHEITRNDWKHDPPKADQPQKQFCFLKNFYLSELGA